MTSEYYKVDDDREPFTDTIPRDLSAGVSEVRFKMEHIVSEETVVNAAASVASSNSDSSTVEYAWSDGDLNRAGLHEAEWRVVYDDGDVEAFPKDDQDNPQIDVSPTIDSGPVADPPLGRVGPHDVYEFNELASDPDPPAANDWALFFKQDGNLYKIDENGTVSQVGGGGSATIAIEDDGTEILGAVSTIDFAGSDFGVSNPTGDEAQVVLTSDSLTVTAGNALTGGGSVGLGGSTTLAVDESAIALANLAGDTDDLAEGASNLFFTDARAQSAINADPDHGSTASHNYYTDSDAVAAINADADHGSTASHNYRTDEEIEDVVNALLAPGTNVSITYDDGTDTLTISATDTDTQLSDEAVEDIVGALITAGNAATVTYDDAGDSLSVGVDESAIDLANLAGTLSAGQLADGAVSEAKLSAADTPASGEVLKYNGSQLEWQPDDTGSGGSAVVLDLGDDGTNESSDLAEIATTNDTNDIVTEPVADKALFDMGQPWPQADDVPDEVIEDVVGALVTGGAKVSTTYDDAGNSLTIDTSALDTEEVEDTVAALVTTDSNLTLNYDDANDTLTIGLADSINVQSVATENSPVADVTAHGAVGDGATDDTQAIQDAINAVEDGTVIFPPGDYLVSGQLTFGGGGQANRLVGMGQKNTAGSQIIYDSGASALSGGVISGDGVEFTEIENLVVNASSNAQRCIELLATSGLFFNSNLSDLHLRNATEDTLWIGGIITSTLTNIYSSGAGRDGIHLEGSDTSVTFYGCYVINPSRHGYYIDGYKYSGFVGCACDDAGAKGYFIDGEGVNPEGVAFLFCGAEFANEECFFVGGAKAVTIVSGFDSADSDSHAVLKLAAVQHVAVIGTQHNHDPANAPSLELTESFGNDTQYPANINFISSNFASVGGSQADAGTWLGASPNPGSGKSYLPDAETNSLTVGGTNITSPTVSVADDGVETVDAKQDQIIFVFGDSGNTQAIFFSSFGGLTTVQTGSDVTNQGDATTLSGTTGPDGSLNLSRDGNTLYVENRIGTDPLDVDVLRFNR